MPKHVTEETAPILGALLKRQRTRRRLTRQQLCNLMFQQLGVIVSHQTLAAYELGTRKMTVQRFVELCYILRIQPTSVMSTMEQTMIALPHELKIDLRSVAACTRAELHPAAAWARTRLVRRKGDRQPKEVIVLRADAVSLLAELCGMSQPDIVAALKAA